MRYFFALVFAVFILPVQAASLLVGDDPFGTAHNYYYGGDNLTGFSSYLDGAFDTVSIGNFNHLSSMLNYDAIWVPGNLDGLSSLQTANLHAYADAGGKLFLQGENSGYFLDRNNWIADFVGATIGATPAIAGTVSSVPGAHELVDGVSQVALGGAGEFASVGTGTALFAAGDNFAGVWGDNVLAVLDVNVFADVYVNNSSVDNDAFARNVAVWLAGSAIVPVPAAVWLFGSALLALGWTRRKTA